MTRAKLISGAVLAFGLAVTAAPVARAQQVSKPIIVQSKAKREKFKGEVMACTSRQITVRSRENIMLVRTFTYTEKVRDQIQQILDRGGYQYGDKVEIEYDAGTDVALKIKGKPSKPL
jgi:hypothetical protein